MITRKTIKQTTISPAKSPLRAHRKTSSILDKRPNLVLMKWNDFLEKYHTVKQMTMINNSIGLINTFFKERQSPLQISDVPYVTSEQAEIQSRVTNPEIPSVSIPISHHFQNDSVNSVFTEPETAQQQALKISLHFQEEDLSEKEGSENKSSSQNFTDEEEEEKRSMFEESKKIDESKKTESTNKASSVIERWPVWEIEKEENEGEKSNFVNENLRKTAHFLVDDQLNDQQNINRSNHTKVLSKKVEVLRKIAEEKDREKLQRKSIIREDKRYLGKFLKRKA